MTARTTKPKIIRPTMVPTLKTPGNKGTEVIMVKTNFGPDPGPVGPLEVATRTTTTGSTDMGETLLGSPAVYSGGSPPVTKLYQWQKSPDGKGSWFGDTNWNELSAFGETTTTYTTNEGDVGYYIRFAAKATDDLGATVSASGNNVGPIVAPAPPFEVDGGSNWKAGNVYEVGETVTALTSSFKGGAEPVTYRYRWQHTNLSNPNEWIQGDWTATTNAKNEMNFILASGVAQVKFQTQATDANGVKVNSSTATKKTMYTLGTAVNDPENVQSLPYGTQSFLVSYDGNMPAGAGVNSPALTYTWTIRSGEARIKGPSTSSRCEVEFTGPAPGSVQVQSRVLSEYASDSPVQAVSMVVIQD